MISYKTYRKLDQLCYKYLPENRYDYCGAFCNNDILDHLLAGDYSKQHVYEQFLHFVFNRLLAYSNFEKVLTENNWFKKLLIRYKYLEK